MLMITLAAQTAVSFAFQDEHDAKLAHQLAMPELVDSMPDQRIAIGDAVESGHAEVVQQFFGTTQNADKLQELMLMLLITCHVDCQLVRAQGHESA